MSAKRRISAINVKHNPVTLYGRYTLGLRPLGRIAGIAEAYFSDYDALERAEVGFGTATFRMWARENLLKEMFDQGLGRHVESWGYGIQQDFEGYIHEMTLVLPPDRFTVSLENTANKIWMRADVNADGLDERSTVYNETDSQSRFGIKELVLAGRQLEGGSAVANQAVQQYLELRSWPLPAHFLGQAAGESTHLEIHCRGYGLTLDWRVYNQTATTGTQNLSVQVSDIITSVGQFIASTDLETNTTQVARVYDLDRRALEILLGFVRLGDSSNNRWVLYVRPKTSVHAVGRQLVLKKAAVAF